MSLRAVRVRPVLWFLLASLAALMLCRGDATLLAQTQPVAPEASPQGEIGAPSAGLSVMSGWFTIIWGDGRPGSGLSTELYFLTDDQGTRTQLLLDPETAQASGGLLALNGHRAVVTGIPVLSTARSEMSAIRVSSIKPDSAASTAGAEGQTPVLGSRPYVSILCKFADEPAETRPLSYYRGMYSNAHPGLDHYWRELSYAKMNLAGSNAFGWYTLPHPVSYYFGGGYFPFNTLTADCIAVADEDVHFPSYTGINLMFNNSFGASYGGAFHTTIDGITEWWPMTWLADWGHESVSVVEHEMGHSFGLPHSSGAYGQVYDNVWDVMSQDRAGCICVPDHCGDPVYGCIGQHTISYHKDILGWIPEDRKYVASTEGAVTLALSSLALPHDEGYLMATIPIGGSDLHYYTVEARGLAGYDAHLPGAAIIIHEVDTTRQRPAFVVDADGNGYTGDDGAMWVPGETFSDPDAGISVTVDSATATGFVVTIATPRKPRFVAPGGADVDNDCAAADAPCATIQHAVDAAWGGDEIWVATGAYTGVTARSNHAQLVHVHKSVTIRGGYSADDWSSSHPITRTTRLDALGQGRVFYVEKGMHLTLEGLHITGGNAMGQCGEDYRSLGGGLCAISADVKINRCRIYGNSAENGGGAYVIDGEFNIDESEVVNNTGGGLYLTHDDFQCPGGACPIRVRISRTLISGNTASGGMRLYDCIGSLSNNRIVGNTAAYFAALDVAGCTLTMTNNVIIDNITQNVEGNAFGVSSSDIVALHTTFARNSPSALDISTGVVTLTNTIVAGHQRFGLYVGAQGAANLNGVLWFGNRINFSGRNVTISNAFTGNPAFAADGYHLTVGSAAIDRGVATDISSDIDGETRPQGSGTDLGADERWRARTLIPLIRR